MRKRRELGGVGGRVGWVGRHLIVYLSNRESRYAAY